MIYSCVLTPYLLEDISWKQMASFIRIHLIENYFLFSVVLTKQISSPASLKNMSPVFLHLHYVRQRNMYYSILLFLFFFLVWRIWRMKWILHIGVSQANIYIARPVCFVRCSLGDIRLLLKVTLNVFYWEIEIKV